MPNKTGMLIEYHPKLVERLARVYLDRYNSHGFDAAAHWYHLFLPTDWQEKVRDAVRQVSSTAPSST